MPQSLSSKQGCASRLRRNESRKHILRMLIRVARERRQRFQLTHSLEPAANRRTKLLLPALYAEHQLCAPEGEYIQNTPERIVPRVHVVRQALQLPDRRRRPDAIARERSLQFKQFGRGELFLLEQRQNAGQD